MDIRCTQSVYPSTGGRVMIACYVLCPEGIEPKGIVQISHGMCEYFSRYTGFARYLCSLGYIVCGNDHLGHGMSIPPGGARGYFGQREGWSVLIDDVARLTDRMKEKYPDLPYFLLGHSMGAMIARLYLARYSDKLTGCILSGTPSNNILASVGVRMANSIIHSHGMMYRSAMLNNFATGKYNSHIAQPNTPFDWLTRDRITVALYQSDEKCNFVFTAAGFKDLFRLVQHCTSPKSILDVQKKLPLLFISGDADPVGGYGNGVKRIVSAYKAGGFRDVTTIMYHDSRHEVLNEINRSDVFEDIAAWLEVHNA